MDLKKKKTILDQFKIKIFLKKISYFIYHFINHIIHQLLHIKINHNQNFSIFFFSTGTGIADLCCSNSFRISSNTSQFIPFTIKLSMVMQNNHKKKINVNIIQLCSYGYSPTTAIWYLQVVCNHLRHIHTLNKKIV